MSDSLLLAPAGGFADLGLDPRLVDALTAHGYTDPTPIQREAIPPLVEGRDLVGLAATGTGKTAAFALPLLTRLAAAEGRGRPSVLILVPTRELCVQVATAVSRYGKPLKVRVVPVYGGAGFGDQVRALRHGADVVVATPGRALDHLRRGTLPLGSVSAVVLDEADEMLDMGFAEDIEAILQATPAERQTMLFSATMPPRIAAIAEKHLTDPVRVTVAKARPAAGEAPRVRQTAYLVYPDHKTAALARVIDFEAPTSAIVFCRTRHEADGVADALAARGHRPDSLHGGLSQEQRDRVMRKFRDGATTLLVATDVAARGLDISHLSHVINYGVPEAAETYVHRTGRVGRAGRDGVAITLAEPRDRHRLRTVERATGQRIDLAPVPTVAELRAKRLDRTRDALRELVRSGGLDEFRSVVGSLTAEFDPADVALAAVALAARAGRADDEADIPSPDVARERSARQSDRPRFGGRRDGMARVFVGAGREAGIDRRDLVGAIESEVGLGARDLGTIVVSERHSVVEVPGELAEQVIDSLQGVRIRGRKVVVRHDRWTGGRRSESRAGSA
ncbi:MAG TPA: DEAD/DEAH box helicase [Fimbriiglobus sp.]|nr:DEAD/DEAH box helicase [Fimbriiglobus sp.]